MENISYILRSNAHAHHLFDFREKPRDKYHEYLKKKCARLNSNMRDSG